MAGRGNLVAYQCVMRLLRPPKRSGGLAMTILGLCKGLKRESSPPQADLSRYGFPLKFIPHLMRGRNDRKRAFFKGLKDRYFGVAEPFPRAR